jgi:hypothetical protein
VDVGLINIVIDDHIPTGEGALWQAVELGGGDATYPAAKGVRVEKVIYTSARDATGSDVVVQGGDYAPTDWYIDCSWRHSGEESPTWRHRRYGSYGSAQSDLDPALWINGPIDLDSITVGGEYWIAGEFLNGDADPAYHTPGNTGLIKLTVTVANPDDTANALGVMQQFVALDQPWNRGQRRRFGSPGTWSDWWTYVGSVSSEMLSEASITLDKLAGDVLAAIAAGGGSTLTGKTLTSPKVSSGNAPASSSSSGAAGQVEWDSSYVYICTAANTWKRVAVVGW